LRCNFNRKQKSNQRRYHPPQGVSPVSPDRLASCRGFGANDGTISVASLVEEIAVPNVEAMVLPVVPSKPPLNELPVSIAPETAPARETVAAKKDVIVTVSKSMSALTVTDTSGHIVFYAPVTTGSKHDPLPIGTWKVNGVKFNPNYHYNPHLFWNADPRDAKATIPAGPNNPVGLVWIDISRKHYGLHGTPEPSTIVRTQSHGCVRLTNWNALRLAGLVKPGTRVVFN
jgi:lipoprotein-anchoring transpeptidase ErfK/SrfK